MNGINQGFLLKKIRKHLDLSGEKFADSLGFSGSYQYNLEKSTKVPKEIIAKIIGIYNINPTYFKTGEGDMFVKTAEEKAEETAKSKKSVSVDERMLQAIELQNQLLEKVLKKMDKL